MWVESACTATLALSKLSAGSHSVIQDSLQDAHMTLPNLTRASVVFAVLTAASRIASGQAGGSVADTSHFRPLTLPTPNESRTGSGGPARSTGSKKSTTDQSRARPGEERNPGTRDDPLYQSFAGHADVPLAVRRAKLLRAEQHHESAKPTAPRVPRHELRLLVPGLQQRAAARVDDDRRAEAKRTRFGTTLRVDLEAPWRRVARST